MGAGQFSGFGGGMATGPVGGYNQGGNFGGFGGGNSGGGGFGGGNSGGFGAGNSGGGGFGGGNSGGGGFGGGNSGGGGFGGGKSGGGGGFGVLCCEFRWRYQQSKKWWHQIHFRFVHAFFITEMLIFIRMKKYFQKVIF